VICCRIAWLKTLVRGRCGRVMRPVDGSGLYRARLRRIGMDVDPPARPHAVALTGQEPRPKDAECSVGV